jgi:hypothetical protein
MHAHVGVELHWLGTASHAYDGCAPTAPPVVTMQTWAPIWQRNDPGPHPKQGAGATSSACQCPPLHARMLQKPQTSVHPWLQVRPSLLHAPFAAAVAHA